MGCKCHVAFILLASQSRLSIRPPLPLEEGLGGVKLAGTKGLDLTVMRYFTKKDFINLPSVLLFELFGSVDIILIFPSK